MSQFVEELTDAEILADVMTTETNNSSDEEDKGPELSDLIPTSAEALNLLQELRHSSHQCPSGIHYLSDWTH